MSDEIDTAFNFLGGEGRAEFEDFQMVGFDEGFKRFEIHGAGAWRAMVTARELDVVDVEANEVGAHGLEVHDMVKEPKIFLNLGVPGVVPVAEVWARQLAEKKSVITLDGKLFKSLAIFRAQFDAPAFGFGQELFDELFDAVEKRAFFRFAPLIEFSAETLIFWGVLLTLSNEVEELVRVVLHVDAAEVEDDGRGIDASGELESFEGVAKGQFAFARAFGGELIQIGGGMVDAHGEGAEVVEAGDADFPGLDGVEDPGHEADASAVAEFSVFKPEVTDFTEHGAAIRVAMGIPTR